MEDFFQAFQQGLNRCARTLRKSRSDVHHFKDNQGMPEQAGRGSIGPGIAARIGRPVGIDGLFPLDGRLREPMPT